MMLNGTLATTIGNLSGLEELYLTQNNIGGTFFFKKKRNSGKMKAE
jgi:hypothetical protein